MNNTESRIEWIDFAKGIAILLVIIYHILGEYSQAAYLQVISTFHNSTFYIISGVLFVCGINNKKQNFASILIKYMSKLLFPFLIWSLIYSSCNMIVVKNVDLSYLITAVNKLWFFPILFLGTLFLWIVINSAIPNWLIGISLPLITLLASFYSSFIAKTVAFIAIVYYGALIKEDVITRSKIYYLFVLSSLAITIINAFMYMMHMCSFEDTITPSGFKLFFYLLSSFFGAIVVIYISQLLCNLSFPKWKLVKWFGTNSLYFYILHNVGMYYLELSSKNNINTIIGFALCLMCPILFIFLFKGTRIDTYLFNTSIKR